MKEKFYITTPIYYVNDAPHLGHAYNAVVTDSVARYQRLFDKEVYFLSGTDEHGVKNIRAAETAGQGMREFVDENTSQFKKLWKELKISNNDFIRTSDQKKHWPGAKELWKKLDESGDIYKAKYKGLYCVGCEAFITEKDLVGGKCPYHNEKPGIIKEENYFFKLSRYAEKIKKAIESDELKIIPASRKNETLSFLKNGLEDVSFSRLSRDVSWDIPVPGDASQTMYVWCDALSNYLSALGYGRENDNKFKKFWPADLHVVGKDILRFHAIIWPGMLFSAGLPLPKAILVHGFITIGGKKMSKTLGNIVDPFDVVSRYSSEALRYYLMRAISPFEDGDFTEKKFKEIYNADLANGLGNFVARTAGMLNQYFEGKISKPDDLLLSRVPLKQTLKSLDSLEYFSLPYSIEHFVWPEYKKFMEGFETHNAVALVWHLLSELDKYIQDYQPFKLIKTDKEKTHSVLWSLAYGAVSVAHLIKPFLPDTSDKILKIFGVSHPLAGGKKGRWQACPPSWREFKIILPKESLFPKKINAETNRYTRSYKF